MRGVIVILLVLSGGARAQERNDAPETSHPEVRLAPDHRTVESSFRALVAAPMRAVAHELMDSSRLPDWVPGLVATRPLHEGFTAEWQLPWPLGRLFEVVHAEQHFEGTDVVLRWQLVRGDLIRHDVCWRLRAISAEQTEVIYAGAVSFRRWVPSFLLRSAQRRALPEAIRRLELHARQAHNEEVQRWSRIPEMATSPRG